MPISHDCPTTEQWLQQTLDFAKTLDNPEIRPCDDPPGRRVGWLVEDGVQQVEFWLPLTGVMGTTHDSPLHKQFEEYDSAFKPVSGMRTAKSRAEMGRRLQARARQQSRTNPDRKCGHCNLPNRSDGHDACLGELPGVMNACCGHGKREPYVQFSFHVVKRGSFAVALFSRDAAHRIFPAVLPVFLQRFRRDVRRGLTPRWIIHREQRRRRMTRPLTLPLSGCL